MANLDPGTRASHAGRSLPYVSDGTGEAGDAVTYDTTNDVVTVTTSSDDRVFGVLGETPEGDGDDVMVHRNGPVVANLGDVQPGEPLAPSGTENGQLVTDPNYADGDSTTNVHGRQVEADVNMAGDLLAHFL